MSEKPEGVRHAVILAAGQSRRLEELKLEKPKPAIEINGKPLLVHHLERCAQHGVRHVFINLHHLPEQIRALAGDGSRWNLKITYHLETTLAGTAGGVKGFSEQLKSGPFFVIYADNYWDFCLDDLTAAHFGAKTRPDMSMVLYEKEDVSQSGVALCDENNFIQAFLEKPAPGQTTGRCVNAGVYLMQPELLDLIPEGPCDFGHTVIPNYLARGKRILGVKTPGRVYSVDTPLLLRETRECFPGP